MALETVLETERLRLTNWLPEHLPDIVRLHGDPEVARYLSLSGASETEAQGRARLEHWDDLFARRRIGKLRVTDRRTGEFLGRAGFGVYGAEQTAELGYAFLRENWGKGYASEAAAALRDWYFRETPHEHFLGFAEMGNHASIAVLRKIGMISTGTGTIESGQVCAFHIYRREQWHG